MTFDEALEEIKTESEENRAVIEEAERMAVLIDIMKQLCVLADDAKKLSNDFGALATQVAVLVAKYQKET